jgi:hypothetical protein
MPMQLMCHVNGRGRFFHGAGALRSEKRRIAIDQILLDRDPRFAISWSHGEGWFSGLTRETEQ